MPIHGGAVYDPDAERNPDRLLPDASYVTLRSVDGTLGPIQVLLGQDPPTPSGGGGGWEAVARPWKRPMLVWRAPDAPYRLTLPLLFDGLAEGRSVEPEIRELERMAGVKVKGDPEPPLLIVEGRAIPHDTIGKKRNLYVIESSPEWGASVRKTNGQRVRQAVTVTLALYAEDDRMERLRSPQKPRYRSVEAKQGDTYEKIAVRELKEYGGARLGRRLARLNGGRSPDVKLKEGKAVKVPAGRIAREWEDDLKKGRAEGRAIGQAAGRLV